MRFKIPPGNLGWLSALWVLLSAFVGYTSFMAGDTFMGGVCVLFCVAGVLIWLDIRDVAWPLIAWFGLVIVSGALLLVLKGLAFRPVWAMAMAALTIYDLYAWRSSE
jgi:hypothetical protein